MVLVYVRSRAEFLKYKRYSVNVMYSGTHCPACVQAKPYFEQLAQQHHGNYMIVDRSQLGLSDHDLGFTLTGIPTFVKYRKDRPVCAPINGYDGQKLQAMIRMK